MKNPLNKYAIGATVQVAGMGTAQILGFDPHMEPTPYQVLLLGVSDDCVRRCWIQEKIISPAPPPIAGAADPEAKARLDAKRVTAEFRTKSTRRLDAGSKPITDSPLFGGDAQGELFKDGTTD